MTLNCKKYLHLSESDIFFLTFILKFYDYENRKNPNSR